MSATRLHLRSRRVQSQAGCSAPASPGRSFSRLITSTRQRLYTCLALIPSPARICWSLRDRGSSMPAPFCIATISPIDTRLTRPQSLEHALFVPSSISKLPLPAPKTPSNKIAATFARFFYARLCNRRSFHWRLSRKVPSRQEHVSRAVLEQSMETVKEQR